MGDFAKEILPINIEEEMTQSYLDYAMSVIVGRALPDVRDGLKPVHRRVLYAMRVLGNDWNKPYKKSARIVGDVIGKYHPHGDTAVYDAIVRMAQSFSLRYRLVDGQGNFGSVDGDAPAAMRYTEIRMSKIAHEILADLDKDTVDFNSNYDDSEHEPSVLPSRLPNLLINGSSGIAVGMATNIPPHNLTEVINSCLALIEDPEIEVINLMQHISGPDFPTAAIINGARGIAEAYATGRGRLVLRSRHHIEEEESNGKETIIVTELPFQVNKAKLIERIAELVKDKKISGITALRDESDKDGMRIVIELRRGEISEVIVNNLYQHTSLQNVFSINMVAIVNGRPKLFNLKEILEEFLIHRREVVTRRTLFELRKARERAHLLEGLAVALSNMDEIIALIKSSANSQQAKQRMLERTWQAGAVLDLLSKVHLTDTRPEFLEAEYGLIDDNFYQLSPDQAQAILDLRLHRLTGLERDKIINEYTEILDQIHALLLILREPDRLTQVIRDELEAIKSEYGDQRKTEIIATQDDLSIADLITEEDRVVTLTHGGYVKTQPLSDYTAQRRGGKGKSATATKDDDFIDRLFIASSHDTVLCFSSRGKVYWKTVFELPIASRISKGKPIVNVLPLEEGERITTMLPVREYEEDKYVFMATQEGVVKKTPLKDFSRPRANGIIALDLRDEDQLIGVDITDNQKEILIFSSDGKATRFSESHVRSMGRVARGVRGIRLSPGAKVISLIIASPGDVLTVTERGFGKRTSIDEYPTKGRGGKGVISIQTSDRNGAVIGAVLVNEDDEIVLISDQGTLVRTAVKGISSIGRNTQGVRLIRLREDEHLVGIDCVSDVEDIEDLDGLENAEDTENVESKDNNNLEQLDLQNEENNHTEQPDEENKSSDE